MTWINRARPVHMWWTFSENWDEKGVWAEKIDMNNWVLGSRRESCHLTNAWACIRVFHSNAKLCQLMLSMLVNSMLPPVILLMMLNNLKFQEVMHEQKFKDPQLAHVRLARKDSIGPVTIRSSLTGGNLLWKPLMPTLAIVVLNWRSVNVLASHQC